MRCFIVRAGMEFDAAQVLVRAFTSEQAAEAFRDELILYHLGMPEHEVCGDVLSVAYMSWCADHPGGPACQYADYFEIVEVPSQ